MKKIRDFFISEQFLMYVLFPLCWLIAIVFIGAFMGWVAAK